MVYEFFIQWLYNNSDLSFLRLFKYITFRSAYAVVTALLLSFMIGPSLIAWLRSKKLDQPIRKDGPETHFGKAGTPTMGGVLILGVIVVSTLLWARLDNVYIVLLLIATIGFGFIGFIDDYKKLILKNSRGLPGKYKLLLQFSIAGIISTAIYIYNANVPQVEESAARLPLYVPFFKDAISDMVNWKIPLYFFDFPIYIPLGMLVIVGSSNAVNLTDGLDGLAIGLMIFVGIAFAILSYILGNYNAATYLQFTQIKEASELTIFCAALIGASMGFLWYNCHPAQVFMGDTGSLSLGGVIGVLALMLHKELLLVIIGGIFVLEAVSVIIQVLYYKWTGKRVFKMAPIHHHFELSGWHESQVIIRLWIIGATLALIAISTLKIQ